MSEVKLKPTGGGAGSISLKAPAATTGNADFPLVLPADDGSADQYLKTDGSGALSWATVASVGGATGVDFNDSVNVRLGTDQDLNLSSDGTNGFIKSPNGNLLLQSDGEVQITDIGGNEYFARFIDNDSVNLYHDGSIKFNTTATGATITGNLKIATAGDGIDFSATSDAAGMASEVLDDYEEGTWTPVWSGGLTSITYTHQYGSYTKIGNRVFFSLYLLTNTGTTGSARLIIGGFPYTNDINHPQAGAYVTLSNNMFTDKHIELYHTGNAIHFYDQGTDLTSSEASPINKNLIIQGFYRV